MCCGVRTSFRNVEGAVLLELLRDFGDEAVVWVRVRDQLLDTCQHCAQVDCGLPRSFRWHVEGVQADAAAVVNVRVVDGRHEPDFGRLEGVPVGHCDLKLEGTTFVW